MIKKFFNMFAKGENANGEEVSAPETTEESVQETPTGEKDKPVIFEPQNEFEEQLIKLENKELSIPAFFEMLFNSVVPALTTEDQINTEENRLVDNPKLFSVFGKNKEPFLAIFSDKMRVDPVINRYNEYNVVIPLPVGDLLTQMNTECGIVLNPYWDKYFMWSAEQVADIVKHIQKIDGRYRFVNPESENTVELQNEKGEVFHIDKEQFRTELLPKEFENSKDDPDKLYILILTALEKGFHKDCLDSARRLFEIDHIKDRGATILGMVLLKNDLVDEAEQVYLSHLEEHKSPVVMVNLAKLYEVQGKAELAFDLLKQTVELDPNFDNALEEYMTTIQKTQGDEAVVEALVELAMIPGSWRPKLFLARERLHKKDLETALGIYKTLLESDAEIGTAFTMITGDLGQHGFVAQIIEFALPYYDVEKHGPHAGMNIIRACLETKNPQVGLSVVERLEKLDIPELQKALEDIRKAFADIVDAVDQMEKSKEQ